MQLYILALIPIILPPLIVLCIHWYNVLVAHLPKSVQTFVTSIVHTAVLASEQSGASALQKKQSAEDAVHTILNSLGYKVDPIYVDTAIEAAVLALHHPKIIVPPVVVAPPVEIVPPLTPISPMIVPDLPTN